MPTLKKNSTMKLLYDIREIIEEIVIPDGVESICNGTFESCTPLKKLTIPDTVTYIGNTAFSHCSSLKELTIPESVNFIGDYAFWGVLLLNLFTLNIDKEKGSLDLSNAYIPTTAKVYWRGEF